MSPTQCLSNQAMVIDEATLYRREMANKKLARAADGRAPLGGDWPYGEHSALPCRATTVAAGENIYKYGISVIMVCNSLSQLRCFTLRPSKLWSTAQKACSCLIPTVR